MSTSTILARVKLSIRLTSTTYDTEISSLIDAAKAYMIAGGVPEDNIETDLALNAICLYVRANFGRNDEAEVNRCMRAVDGIIYQMSLTQEEEDDSE